MISLKGRLVHALPGRLSGLRIAGQDDLMLEGLHQTLVLMTFLKDVADGGFGEVSGGDESLSFSRDADVCWYRHGILLG